MAKVVIEIEDCGDETSIVFVADCPAFWEPSLFEQTRTKAQQLAMVIWLALQGLIEPITIPKEQQATED